MALLTIIEIKTIIEISACLTFVSGIITLVVENRKSRKITFINTVTTARKEYIKKLRTLVVEFCIEKSEKKAYQLKLMMNPAGYIGRWDDEAVRLIDEIVRNKHQSDIDKFVALMQSWLALEWHGMMNEGKSGILNPQNKDALRKKFWREYNKYLNHKNYV